MADFQTIYDAQNLRCDWVMGPAQGSPASAVNDIATDGALQTALLISLFTDRLANADDDLPDNSGDRRGWWGDLAVEPPADGTVDLIGSRLWLLSRAKQTTQTAIAAQGYVAEALQWMIDDGVAADVAATVTFPALGQMAIRVVISRIGAGGTTVNHVYDVLWDITLGTVAVSATN